MTTVPVIDKILCKSNAFGWPSYGHLSVSETLDWIRYFNLGARYLSTKTAYVKRGSPKGKKDPT